MTVLFVAVNFNGTSHTGTLLESLSTLRGRERMRTIVVDNASTDSSGPLLRAVVAGHPGVTLLEADTWLGYFGAANWGIETALQAGDAPDWIVVSNNDVVIDDPSLLDRILALSPEGVGVVAPATISLRTGLDQNPFMWTRPSRLRMLQLRLFLSSYATARTVDYLSRTVVRPFRQICRTMRFGTQADRSALSDSRTIYAPHATFLIIPRQFFTAGGVLDAGCGLCCEELMMAEVCRRVGLAVVYNPTLRILHNEHSTVGQKLNRTMYGFHRRALQYVSTKYLSDAI